MYGAWLLDVPFSFTGHAADLFRERVALCDKIQRADFIVCISRFHRDFYLANGAREEQLHIVYCGIDLSEFESRPLREDAARPRVVSVGRLVEKKGFADLLEACALLSDRGVDLECIIAGRGPLEEDLRRRAEERGVADRVTVTGEEIRQEELPDFLATADVFAQPCVQARDGDVDGIPRTLMEAMAIGRPCVSTEVAGIPDLIQDGHSGLMVEPGNSAALADAIARLFTDRALCKQLVAGGHEQLRAEFDLSNCLDPLAALFRAKLDTHE
jgi:glycosyltransferase involved in cell wall biosynthesis